MYPIVFVLNKVLCFLLIYFFILCKQDVLYFFIKLCISNIISDVIYLFL